MKEYYGVEVEGCHTAEVFTFGEQLQCTAFYTFKGEELECDCVGFEEGRSECNVLAAYLSGQ